MSPIPDQMPPIVWMRARLLYGENGAIQAIYNHYYASYRFVSGWESLISQALSPITGA